MRKLQLDKNFFFSLLVTSNVCVFKSHHLLKYVKLVKKDLRKKNKEVYLFLQNF